MARPKSGLDRRILQAADRLFYAHGYPNTGIQQIVSEAGTNRPGLYSYFDSKDDLARRYLEARNVVRTEEIAELGRQAADVPDFFRRWMDNTRGLAAGKTGPYKGCAVANFALQTDSADEEMQAYIQKAGRRWESQLVAYIRSELRAGRFAPDNTAGAASIARRMLILYQGAITMWKLTGRLACFEEACELFELSLQSAGRTEVR